MNQNFDFPLEKLSAPVEYLNLDQRALNTLRRIKIQTVSQIIATGKYDLLLMKKIGPKMVDRIFWAVTEYLEISETRLESDEIRQVAWQPPERPQHQLNISIVALDLPTTVILSLHRARVFQVGQLVGFKANHYEGNREFGSRQREQIDRAVRLFLRKLDEINAAHSATPQLDGTNQTQLLMLSTDLKVVLDSLQLDEHTWSVVELKAMRLLTLEKIGLEIGGISRERVRQMIDWTYKKVENKLSFLAAFCDYLDERAKRMRAEMTTEELTLTALINEFERQLSGSDFVVTKEDLKRLITLVRLLVISEKPWVLDEFQAKRKDLTFLACLAEQPIKKHNAVRQFLEAEKRKREGYKELAYTVLAEAKRSLHWSDIAEKARQLNKKEGFEADSLRSILALYQNLFVRVGPGTYELAEWGRKQVESYPDIMASALKQENQAMPFDLIFTRVSAIRLIKQSSLEMYLEMHPRFYKSIHNTFGLRGWLAPGEKQNPHIPEWLVEDFKSARRVERAKARGYDVDKLIVDDKLP